MGVHSKGIGWTAERDDALRKAWAAGTVARQIAADLGGFGHCKGDGKNSVLSRVHTLGLPKRTERKRALAPEERERRLRERLPVKLAKLRAKRAGVQYDPSSVVEYVPRKPTPKPPAVPYEPKGISFADLRDFKASEPNQCRYIDIKDAGPNFLYCGSETLPGETYCGHCHAICHDRQPTPKYLTPEQREKREVQGRALGFANVRKGRGFGRTFTPSMVPVVNGEAIV